MKVGIELRIDVTKIDRERIYEGKKGKYLTMTAFVDLDNHDEYGNSGMITHKKDEGEDRAPILGNSKVFWKDGGQKQAPPQQQGYQNQAPQQYAQAPQQNAAPQQAPQQFEDDGEIPF